MEAPATAAPLPHPSRTVIDMRSDTVTRPTPAMRHAMATAEVGDDVYGDDPTVNALQAYAAQLTGKEAALFVPSGTMGNLLAVLTHCPMRGDEYIVGDQAHIHIYEQGGTASLGSVHPRTVPTSPDGTLDLALLEASIRTLDDHFPTTRLICLENTHNRCGGRVLHKAYIDAVAALAHRHHLQLHIDGARIMNACIADHISLSDLVQHADSVSICLSKGLAAPIGSLLVGTADFILRAKRLRKAVGGGMRQAGVVAAAGLVALKEMVERLEVDHANARRLAVGLEGVKGLKVNAKDVDSNIVYVRVREDEFGMREMDLQAALKAEGVWMGVTGVGVVRFVVHYEVSEADIDHVVDVITRLGQRNSKGAGEELKEEKTN